MSKLNYQYDEPRLPRPSQGNGRLRLVGLFLVVAAITAGGIYLLIPHSDPAKSPSENPTDTALSSANATDVATVTPPPANVTQAPDLATSAVSPTEATDVPATPVETPAAPTEETPVLDEKTPPPVVAEKNTAPVAESLELPKGQVTPLDPPDSGPVIAPVQSQDEPWQQKFAQAQALFKTRSYAPAAALGAEVVAHATVNSELYRQAGALLAQANLHALAQGQHPAGLKVVKYRVQAGDNLTQLAEKYHATIEGLKHLNHLKNQNQINIGQRLRILPGPWQVKVEKNARLLKVTNLSTGTPQLFAIYDVGIGRFGKTPTAKFVISARLRHPVWRTPDGRVYAHGDPENQLGNYFLKLATPSQPKNPLRGYGIHGTPDESTVSRSLSNGCVRMRNAEVEMLYYLLPTGTPVEITE